MACDINIGFGKVRLGIRRDGSAWANKEECTAFEGVKQAKRKEETEQKEKENSETIVLSDSILHSHDVLLWASAVYYSELKLNM